MHATVPLLGIYRFTVILLSSFGVEIESHPNIPFRSVGGHAAAEPGVPLRHSRDQRDRRPEAVPLGADVLQRGVAGEQALDQRDRHRLGRDRHRTTKCECSIDWQPYNLFTRTM